MAPSPTIRRLLKETAELSASSPNPNPTFHAAPVSDSNLHEWHFTLLGPPSPSPYAGGLYHGRITLPTTYPLKPPNFRFLTPSGRFEVNREICLSISGFHEETWMPAWGVRTALTALRSFMAEKGSAGQVGGIEAKVEVRERLARESKNWRCEGCGGRPNSEIMREWWEICKERGVRVAEEMSLEQLPEGLSLEAREPGSKREEGQQPDRTETQQVEPLRVLDSTSVSGGSRTDAEIPSLLSEQPLPSNLAPAPPAVPSVAQPPSSANRTQAEHSAVPGPVSPGAQSAPPTTSNAPSKPHDSRMLMNQQHTSHHPEHHGRTGPITPLPNPTTNTTTTPAPTPTVAIPDGASPDAAANTNINTNTTNSSTTNADDPTSTIDKAIGALFVALLIMILKKIFYPASSGSGTGGGSGGGSMDGMYMSGD